MPGFVAVSTLHQPRNDILLFFKFLQNKVSWLDKKSFYTFLYNFVDCNLQNYVAKPLDSLN